MLYFLTQVIQPVIKVKNNGEIKRFYSFLTYDYYYTKTGIPDVTFYKDYKHLWPFLTSFHS
jgi:hypothetical protein